VRDVSSKSGVIPLLLAAFLWSTIGLATKRALNAGSDAFWIGGMRAGVSAVLSSIFLRRRVLDFKLALIGIFFTGPLYLIYVFSVMHSGIGIAAVLLYTAPVIVIILAKFLLNESLNTRKLIALILSFSGIVAIGLRGGGNLDLVAIALGLGSSLSYSGIILGVRKLAVSGYDEIELGLGPQVWAALELLPLLSLSRGSLNLDSMISIVYLGIFPSFLAYYLHAMGLKRIEAGPASIISNLEPISALILGIFLGEQPGLLGFLGSALIISSAIIVSWRR
jgi:DME family drug/metabolite transporter